MSTLERLEHANPVADTDRLLSAPGAMDDFVLAVKERSGIVQTAEDQATIEVPTQTQTKPPPRGWRRRLVPALVMAAAVIAAIVVGVALLSGDDEPDVGATPLEVGEALNEAVIKGDWEAARRLYADDATFTDNPAIDLVGDAGANILMAGPFEPPYSALINSDEIVDWDSDGAISVFDGEAGWLMDHYASGITAFHSCSPADATSVVCDVLYEGYAFRSNDPVWVSNTYTVVDGRIVHQTFDFSTPEGRENEPQGLDDQVSLRFEYYEWIVANHRELEDELFSHFGVLSITPDTIDTHRELVTEWQAQR